MSSPPPQHGGRKLIVVDLRLALAARAHQRGGDAVRPRLCDERDGAEARRAAGLAVTSPPDMRDEICHGRGRAGMIAMQEEFVASAMAEGAERVRRRSRRRADDGRRRWRRRRPRRRSRTRRRRWSRCRCSSARSRAGPGRCWPRATTTSAAASPVTAYSADKKAEAGRGRQRAHGAENRRQTGRQVEARAYDAAGAGARGGGRAAGGA